MRGARAAVPAAIVIFAVAAVAALWQDPESPPVLFEGPALGQASLPVPPARTPIPVPPDGLLQGLVRAEGSAGGPTVAVIWLSPEYLRLAPESGRGFDPQRYLVFLVVVDSPALKLFARDLKGMIYLRDESGKEYGTPTWVPREEGARKEGVAAFPRADARGNSVPSAGSRFLEIVIRDLFGAKQRVFRWDLEI